VRAVSARAGARRAAGAGALMAGGRGGRYYHPEVVDYYRENQARPSPRTDRTRRVPHPVLIGHAASLTLVDYYRENQAAAAPRPPLPVPHAAAAAGSGGVTRAGIGDICPFSSGLTRAGGAGAVR
jgi:hypothetical protein